jgi:hypothetical protein
LESLTGSGLRVGTAAVATASFPFQNPSPPGLPVSAARTVESNHVSIAISIGFVSDRQVVATIFQAALVT